MTTISTTNGSRVTVGVNRATLEPWESFGDFCVAVMHAELNPLTVDPRLMAAAGANTLNGPDGGYVTRGPTLENFTRKAIRQSVLAPRVDFRVINTFTYEALLLDESARTDGTRHGGVEMSYIEDGGQYPTTNPKLRQARTEFDRKFGAIVPVPEKMLRNSPTIAGDIEAVAAREVAFTWERMIWNGIGVGQPLGVRSTRALIEQAIEGSQTLANSATYLAINAAKMLPQVFNLDDAAFYMHQDNLTALVTSTIGDVPSGAVTPPDDGAPFGRLWTRPMFPLEVAPAPGTVGDFVLASMSDYLFVTRGIEKAISLHVKFLTAESLFRITCFFDGQPKCSGTITPFTGTTVQSPYVALAARS